MAKRIKPSRRISATAPADKLPTTTRPSELGGNRALKVGGANRFSTAALEILEPSFAAIELATYLRKPADFLANLRAASRPNAKHELTPEEIDFIRALRKSRQFPPPEREDKIKEFRTNSRKSWLAKLREYRAQSKRWCALVRMYERRREELLTYDDRVLARLCRNLEKEVARAASNDVPAATRAEARWRAANRKEIRSAAKRNRKAFGHRKFRRPIPVKPNGEIDCKAMAERDLIWQSAKGVETGISIDFFGDKYVQTEELRIAKRITEQMQDFLNWKDTRSKWPTTPESPY